MPHYIFFLKVRILVAKFLVDLLFVASLHNAKGMKTRSSCFLFCPIWRSYEHIEMPHFIFFLKVGILVAQFWVDLLFVASLLNAKGQRLISTCFFFLSKLEFANRSQEHIEMPH